MNEAGNYQENLSKQQLSTTAAEPKEYIEGERECRRRVHLQDDRLDRQQDSDKFKEQQEAELLIIK